MDDIWKQFKHAFISAFVWPIDWRNVCSAVLHSSSHYCSRKSFLRSIKTLYYCKTFMSKLVKRVFFVVWISHEHKRQNGRIFMHSKLRLPMITSHKILSQDNISICISCACLDAPDSAYRLRTDIHLLRTKFKCPK